jgi:peptidoglycan/LPS O-acetylase OafA/YrhL
MAIVVPVFVMVLQALKQGGVWSIITMTGTTVAIHCTSFSSWFYVNTPSERCRPSAIVRIAAVSRLDGHLPPPLPLGAEMHTQDLATLSRLT